MQDSDQNTAKFAEIIFTHCKYKHAEGLSPRSPCDQHQDAWRHYDESSLCRRARSRCYRQVREVATRPETVSPSQHERRLTEARL